MTENDVSERKFIAYLIETRDCSDRRLRIRGRDDDRAKVNSS